MTVFLPLEDSAPWPSLPPFVVEPNNAKTQLAKVIKTILKAKRIVVVCGKSISAKELALGSLLVLYSGAGISVQAGIPDFRSSEGLFQSLKKDNRDTIASGKDLFDASVFNVSQEPPALQGAGL